MRLKEMIERVKKPFHEEIKRLRFERDEAVKDVWKGWSRDKFGEEIVVEYKNSIYYVNDCRVELEYIDEYNNASIIFHDKLSVNYFKAFMDFWLMKIDWIEKSCYKYRTVSGLFINLWKQHFQAITAEELFELIAYSLTLPVEGNNHEKYGFYAFILTSSYKCNPYGILNYRYPYNRWQYKDNFIKLFADIMDIPPKDLKEVDEGHLPPHWYIIARLVKINEDKGLGGA